LTQGEKHAAPREDEQMSILAWIVSALTAAALLFMGWMVLVAYASAAGAMARESMGLDD
jgi:hypothetical protein